MRWFNRTLPCLVCHRSFPKKALVLSVDGNGRAICPDCLHCCGEAEAFAELVKDLAAPIELDHILERLVGQAKILGRGDLAFLALVEPDGQALVIRAQTGAASTTLKGLTLTKGKGMAGKVLETGKPLITADYLKDPRFCHDYDAVASAEGTMAQAAVPILHAGTPWGVLLVSRRVPQPFMPADLQLLTRLADAANVARHQALLYQQATSRAMALERLWHVGQGLSKSLSLRETLDRVVQSARGLLRTDHAVLRLWDAANQCLTLAAQTGSEVLPFPPVFRPGEGVVGIVAQTRRPLIVNDYQAFPYRLPNLSAITAAIAAPLLVEERLIGVLSAEVTEPGRTFTTEGLRLLELLAQQAAIAVENARLYEERRMAAIHLEAMVEERTRELQAANAACEVASHHKSEFLANMSHELRTPLNSILGFSEILREQTVGPLTEKQARYVGHIWSSGKHLLQLINDILDLSKVEAGKFVLQPEHLPVSQTLEDILVIARGLAHKKGQTVETEFEANLPPLRADPIRFKQILFNLLNNAVKFTPERGRITLTAGRASAARECLELRLTDTGRGIRPEDLPRLFQEFTQLETTRDKRHEGAGLGLALTKRLVELHGGQIWAESEGEGRGSTFTVVLPFGGPAPVPVEER